MLLGDDREERSVYSEASTPEDVIGNAGGALRTRREQGFCGLTWQSSGSRWSELGGKGQGRKNRVGDVALRGPSLQRLREGRVQGRSPGNTEGQSHRGVMPWDTCNTRRWLSCVCN